MNSNIVLFTKKRKKKEEKTMYINWVYASSPQTPAIRNKSKDWLAQI
jgi:hypothetical protein